MRFPRQTTCAATVVLAVVLTSCYALPEKSEFLYATPQEQAADADGAADATGTDVADDLATADVDAADADAVADAAPDAALPDADAAADGDVAAEVATPDAADADTADVASAFGAVTAFRGRAVAAAFPRAAGQPWGVAGASATAGTWSGTKESIIGGLIAWIHAWLPGGP